MMNKNDNVDLQNDKDKVYEAGEIIKNASAKFKEKALETTDYFADLIQRHPYRSVTVAAIVGYLYSILRKK